MPSSFSACASESHNCLHVPNLVWAENNFDISNGVICVGDIKTKGLVSQSFEFRIGMA